MASGLFVGLVTLDLIYLVQDLPQRNQKIVALDYTMAAGGPATNAAVTFQHLGNTATVLGMVGSHPVQSFIAGDLTRWGVAIADLDPHRLEPPPTSSIVVTRATGERTVISLNAVKSQASPDQIPANLLQAVQIMLIDGHQMAVGETLAQQARDHQIPVVLDGGSWKLGLERILPWVDYAICSANFYPPDCRTEEEVFTYLRGQGIEHIAITHGEYPIRYWDAAQWGQLPVPSIHPVDTLGAGDIFHGAFCHFILQSPFVEALTHASKITAQACQSFGTRRWMEIRESL